ncbi:hypothetical protein K504DRAFT_496843 [Pleomassaria siparia CBS 279.74]|uniref:Uncharacterized protein n=1 Tax=Pleomassaria siparia CBS 279.74 TaxID=1314801 RepID=A0A6G1KPX5_9PLEO|nr:hypothetical protein K504DRAFT_496843 [Pleomassaria siparia CBS 279.74]
MRNDEIPFQVTLQLAAPRLLLIHLDRPLFRHNDPLELQQNHAATAAQCQRKPSGEKKAMQDADKIEKATKRERENTWKIDFFPKPTPAYPGSKVEHIIENDMRSLALRKYATLARKLEYVIVEVLEGQKLRDEQLRLQLRGEKLTTSQWSAEEENSPSHPIYSSMGLLRLIGCRLKSTSIQIGGGIDVSL